MQDSYLKDIKILISSAITAFCLPVSGCASSMDQVDQSNPYGQNTLPARIMRFMIIL